MMIKRTLLCAALLAAGLSGPAVAASPSQFYTYDPAELALAKQKLAARDPLYQPSYDKLIKEADAALTHKPYSVVDKTLAPASGNKHDFFSFGPYWWPDPAKKDGLPYIRKDGLHNPASSTDATDSVRMGKFSHDVTVLALAWYFTGEKKYAAKAGELARAWFLAPETRMNPNLDYGQAIPGRVNGRGIGIISSRSLIDVMDSLALIQPTDALSDAENDGVRAWYRYYLNWLLNSRNGFEESNAHNNHGTFYSAQVTAYALYTGQQDIARRELEITQIRRIAGQIDREGKLIAELERTRPSGYVNFALEAFGYLGRYGELTGQKVWEHGEDAHSIAQGYRFVARYVNGEKWPYPEIDPKEGSPDGVNQHAMHNMLAAARAYPGEPVFAEKARWLLEHYPGQVDALILPLK
ncbi:alginate lyase family protein [Duganella aquatilis]|uniref:alginate lyase family protein n=1 Tax=Duganella aquatilis TaxID=2666082 RepID=UPI001AA0A6BD|nr:alginate lyase family protein [Duganella aquatilis]